MIEQFKDNLIAGIQTVLVLFIPHYHFTYIDEIIECVYNGELYKDKIESLDPLNVKIIEKKESLKTNYDRLQTIIDDLDKKLNELDN